MRPVAGILAIFALAAGCATVPPPAGDADAAWRARQAQLKTVTGWHLQGRLAVRAADQGWHATVNWERDGERHRLDFTGPLGRGHMRLVQDSRGAELRDAQLRTLHADNAQQLLQRATGWQVPLDGLNFWILGLPAPGSSISPQLDAYGRLQRLAQSGWDIQFLEYSRYGALDLPTKLYIRGDERAPMNPAGEDTLEVRLVIERWAFKQ